MDKEALKALLEKAYEAGFNDSGEGYNAEYPGPVGNWDESFSTDEWVETRNKVIAALLADA